MKGFFNIQEYHSRIYVIVKIKGDVVHKPHIHCSNVLWQEQKRNWLPLSGHLSWTCLWTIFRITFSNSLPVVHNRLIWHKFWGNFGSLPGFSNILTCSFIQDFGKWDSQRQWLNKCVRCTSCLLEMCLRHSFGIPSSLQALLNFNEFTNLCMPQGLTFPTGVSATDARRAWTL
jgi:hypothetical protein